MSVRGMPRTDFSEVTIDLDGDVGPDDLIAEGVDGLDLPLGRRLPLPGRGVSFVREVEGPPGAPTVLLLHGWVASGGMNWHQAFRPLSKRYNVVAPDLRGHGRGIRSWRRFRLADCADDVAETIKTLGTGPVIVVGYSMGGPVAQLLWQRHPHLVDGMVLAATGSWMVPGLRQQIVLVGIASAAAGGLRATWGLPEAMRRMIPLAPSGSRPSSLQVWAAGEMRRHDWRMVTEAGTAIATFDSRKWLGNVDVPTTVLVTAKDRAVSPLEQLRTALHIPGAEIIRYDEGHIAPIRPSFGQAVTKAVDSVAARL